MSVTVLYIIPKDPYLIPELDKRNKALEIVNKIQFFPGIKNEIYEEILENPRLYDCGEEFERIICPFCSKEIDIKYWQKIMDKSYQDKFRNMVFITNCCNKKLL